VEPEIVSRKRKKNLSLFGQQRRFALVGLAKERSELMRKIILTLAAIAAVGTATIPQAEARGFGRGAAIGAGIGAAALGAAVATGAFNNGYYGPGYGYGPADGYYGNPGYYDDGPRVYQRRVYRNYDAW
jgi:hypothetical protein